MYIYIWKWIYMILTYTCAWKIIIKEKIPTWDIGNTDNFGDGGWEFRREEDNVIYFYFN